VCVCVCVTTVVQNGRDTTDTIKTRRQSAECTVHLPPTMVFPRLAVNKTILKPRLGAVTGRANTHMWDFHDVIKFCVAAQMISEKAIRFQQLDDNPDRLKS